MKSLIVSVLLSSAAIIGFNKSVAQTAVNTQTGAKIEFNKDVHDYGDVKFGGDGVCTFVFTNTGTENLVIDNARGSCGCTVPEWPKEPIAPGAKATITVRYDTKKVGAINKSITITSNAVDEPTKILRIKGNVAPQIEGASPVENSGPVNN